MAAPEVPEDMSEKPAPAPPSQRGQDVNWSDQWRAASAPNEATVPDIATTGSGEDTPSVTASQAADLDITSGTLEKSAQEHPGQYEMMLGPKIATEGSEEAKSRVAASAVPNSDVPVGTSESPAQQHPAPNEIDIAGEAVALDCTGAK